MCVSVSHIANVRGVMSLILYHLSKKATMQSNKFTSKECKTALTSLSSVFSCGKWKSKHFYNSYSPVGVDKMLRNAAPLQFLGLITYWFWRWQRVAIYLCAQKTVTRKATKGTTSELGIENDKEGLTDRLLLLASSRAEVSSDSRGASWCLKGSQSW